MNLFDPSQEIIAVTAFLRDTFSMQNKKHAVIAVSGGIDSAVSLTLLAKALGPENVYPLFLPYGDQSTADSETIVRWNKIPEKNWGTVNIKSVVDLFVDTICHSGKGGDEEPYPESSVDAEDSGSPISMSLRDLGSRMTDIRRGNIMARVRMICVFDQAKKLDALVCGTENKSEHYLGYFTRFGDSASDIEPICQLYKTQVREVAKELGIPKTFLEKSPSAGLWENQTDENEMGFSYEDADKTLAVLLGESDEIIEENLLAKVKAVVDSQAFKLQVPYIMTLS